MTKSEKIARINNELTVAIAEEKAKRAKSEADYYANMRDLRRSAQEMMESVQNEPDEQQDNNQPTQWLNGEQWTAAVVSRRILNKLPKIPYNCAVSVDICHYNMNDVSLSIKAYNPAAKYRKFVELYLASHMEIEEQAANTDKWLKDAEKHFSVDASDDEANSMDKMFGGNPLDDFPTLDRKEADNE